MNRNHGTRALYFVFALAFALLAGVSEARSPATSRPSTPQTEAATTATETAKISSARIQMAVMDFSDQYVSAMWAVMDEYIRNEPDPSKRVRAQAWKVLYGSSSMEIAASLDPRTNLLDMAIFISLGKWSVNRYWIPKVFGDRAEPLRKLYDSQYKKVWKMLAEILTPQQQASLRALLAAWESENPAYYEVADVRIRNLDGVRAGEFDSSTARGLLASVQKLIGQVDTSLLYGERVMFYMERTPRILTQQTDLTLAQITEAFPIAAIRPESIANLPKDWPLKLQESIDHNHALAKELLPEVRATLENADHLASTLNTTLQSVQGLADRKVLPSLTPEDISKNLQEVNSILDHLDSTLTKVNLLLEKKTDGADVAELAKLLDARADHILNAAFRRLLILLGLFFAGIILILIAARILFIRSKG
ncbi:MAG: hypothetical protein ABI615_00230 [Chthoniobacterales bacterium]